MNSIRKLQSWFGLFWTFHVPMALNQRQHFAVQCVPSLTFFYLFADATIWANRNTIEKSWARQGIQILYVFSCYFAVLSYFSGVVALHSTPSHDAWINIFFLCATIFFSVTSSVSSFVKCIVFTGRWYPQIHAVIMQSLIYLSDPTIGYQCTLLETWRMNPKRRTMSETVFRDYSIVAPFIYHQFLKRREMLRSNHCVQWFTNEHDFTLACNLTNFSLVETFNDLFPVEILLCNFGFPPDLISLLYDYAYFLEVAEFVVCPPSIQPLNNVLQKRGFILVLEDHKGFKRGMEFEKCSQDLSNLLFAVLSLYRRSMFICNRDLLVPPEVQTVQLHNLLH